MNVGTAQLIGKYRQAHKALQKQQEKLEAIQARVEFWDQQIKLATGRTQSWHDNQIKIKTERAHALRLLNEGKSLNDIASLLSISIWQAKSRIKQAKKQHERNLSPSRPQPC